MNSNMSNNQNQQNIPSGHFLSAEQHLGIGGSGYVSIVNIGGTLFALKRPNQSKLQVLVKEGQMYEILGCNEKIIGFPQIFNMPGMDFRYLLMTLVGEDLWQLRVPHPLLKDEQLFSLWEQAIERVEYIHNAGIIHGDIKPPNMALGTGQESKVLQLFDFGNAIYYQDMNTMEHLPIEHDFPLTCTMPFASVHNLNGSRPARRDDLESLFYSMVTLLLGPEKSPWITSGRVTRDEMLELKLGLYNQQFFMTISQPVFNMYMHIIGLEYEETPDYGKLRSLVREAATAHNLN